LGWRVAAIGLAALMGCCGLLLIYWSIFVDTRPFPVPSWMLFLTGLFGIAEIAYLAILTTTFKASYDSDAVEIRCAVPFPPSWWGRTTGRMLRSDVAAKKKFGIGSIFMPTYVLYPKARNEKNLVIWARKEDEYFRNWIAGIPDANKQFFRNRRESK
jgi:hypothetical protein